MSHSTNPFSSQVDSIEFIPHEGLLKELIDMGFTANAATRGLFYTGNRSLDMAANWIVENEETYKGINDPVLPGELKYPAYSPSTYGGGGAGGGLSAAQRVLFLMYYPPADGGVDMEGGYGDSPADLTYTQYPGSTAYARTNGQPSLLSQRMSSTASQPRSGSLSVADAAMTYRSQVTSHKYSNVPAPNDDFDETSPRVAGLGRQRGGPSQVQPAQHKNSNSSATTPITSVAEEYCMTIVLDHSLGMSPVDQATTVARACLRLAAAGYGQSDGSALPPQWKAWKSQGEKIKVLQCNDACQLSRLHDAARREQVLSVLVQDLETLPDSYSEHDVCVALFGEVSTLNTLTATLQSL